MATTLPDTKMSGVLFHLLLLPQVTLRAHRTNCICASATSAGVTTVSSLGSIKMWPAEELAREAERHGLQLGLGQGYSSRFGDGW